MTKGEKLIWELFLWLREVMPATPENTRRQTEWAAVFHQMEHPETPPPPPPEAQTSSDVTSVEPDEPELEVDKPDEPDPDPHEHGVPVKPKPARKKR